MSEIKTTGVRTILDAGRAALEELPGVSSAFALFRGAAEIRAREDFEEFIRGISIPWGFENVEEAARRIDENINKEWMISGMEEGWKKAREALDPVAKRCIYVMVSDYLTREATPDRAHRQLGQLLAEADLRLLRIILRVADGLHKADYPEGSLAWVYGATDEPSPKYHELLLEGKRSIRLEPEGTVEAADLMIRNAVAGVATGFGGHFPLGEEINLLNYMCLFRPHHLPFWRKLRPYLQPVRQANAAAGE